MHRRSRYKRLTIIALPILLFLAHSSQAQTILKGRIFEFKTRIPLEGMRIENLKSHVIAVSDSGGRFAIKAVAGNLITYSGLSYKTDTIYVANLKYKEVFLELKPDQLLKEVKIVNKEVNLGTVAIPSATPFGGNTVRYQTDASGNYSGGVKINLPGFNSEEKKKERDAQLAADEETQEQIAKVFSSENLQKYLPIKGQEMENFRILYTPSVKVYREKLNITLYVDSCYKVFVKLPIEKRQSKEFLQLNNKP